jgi:hypothetical protein
MLFADTSVNVVTQYPLERVYLVDPSCTLQQRVRASSLEPAYYIDTNQSFLLNLWLAF